MLVRDQIARSFTFFLFSREVCLRFWLWQYCVEFTERESICLPDIFSNFVNISIVKRTVFIGGPTSTTMASSSVGSLYAAVSLLLLLAVMLTVSDGVDAARQRYVPKWKKQACEIPSSQNEHSHYVCDDDGDVKCLPGWQGDLCDVPICRKGCDPQQGKSIVHIIPNITFSCDTESPIFQHQVTATDRTSAAASWAFMANVAIAAFRCLAVRMAAAMLPSNVSAIAAGTVSSVRNVRAKNTDYKCTWCLINWFAVTAICRSDCHQTRGYCELPGECKCRLGWAGPTCKECQVLPGCQHGTCSQPLECKCKPGWMGILCHLRKRWLSFVSSIHFWTPFFCVCSHLLQHMPQGARLLPSAGRMPLQSRLDRWGL